MSRSSTNSILLTFAKREQSIVHSVTVDPEWNIRWAAWSRSGEEAVLVGDRGLMLRYRDDRFQKLTIQAKQHLRCASYNPEDSTILAVGNKGTIIQVDDTNRVREFDQKSSQNLRRVSWSPDASYALIVGNDGTGMVWDRSSFTEIEGALNNLRSLAWGREGTIFVSGNYFATSMIPSSTLYKLDYDAKQFQSVAVTEKTDIISIDPGTEGQLLAVGYDLVWQEPRAYIWNGQRLQPVKVQEVGIYPTSVASQPRNRFALVGTGSPKPVGQGGGMVLGYTIENGIGGRLFEDSEHRIQCIAWRPQGDYAFIVGNRSVQTFST